MSEVVNIYTDGACRGNPGPGGWAAIILTLRDQKFTVRGGDPNSTNNRMEITAAIKGLQQLDYWIPEPRDLPVILHSDSKYLTDAFNQNWLGKWQKNGWSTSTGQSVSNRDLWEVLLLLTKQRNITWQWVKAHSGDYFNEICDRMATEEAETAAQPSIARPQEKQDDFQTGGGYELETVEPGRMEVLDLIFRIVAEAKSFKHFKERMGRLGGEYQLGTVLREHLSPSAGRENAAPLDRSQPEENEHNDPPSESGK